MSQINSNDLLGKQIKGSLIKSLAVIFFVAGIFTLFWSTKKICKYNESSDWLRVPAKIQSVEMTEWKDNKGRKIYGIDCKYSYSLQNEDFIGSKIFFEDEDSFDFEEKNSLFLKLKKSKDNNSPLQIFVNPKDKSEAFIFRAINLGMCFPVFFGVIFSLGGLVTTLVMRNVSKDSQNQLKLLSENPNKPWLAFPDLKGNQLNPNPNALIVLDWLLGSIFLIFVVFTLVLKFLNVNIPFLMWIFTMASLIAGLLILLKTARKHLQLFKSRKIHLKLPTVPICPGQKVLLKAFLPEELSTPTVNCEILCEKKSFDSSENKIEKLFAKKFVLSAQQEGGVSKNKSVSIEMIIPEEFSSDNHLEENSTISWKLIIEAEQPLINYYAEFSLPVFSVKQE